MNKVRSTKLKTALSILLLFTIWTVLLQTIDVQPVGPYNSEVGFATINRFFHNLTGVHMWLYTVTDWAGLVPVAFGFGFAALGLVQWIKRKKIWEVDSSILILGGYYILVLAAYLLFEENTDTEDNLQKAYLIALGNRLMMVGQNINTIYDACDINEAQIVTNLEKMENINNVIKGLLKK